MNFQLIRRVGLLCLIFFAVLRLDAEVKPAWTTPLAPFRIADNLYYVGSQDLAAYLVTTPAGNILINANLPSSPPLIRASVEKLGFRWQDTKILLNSQAHFDHAGGYARVLRETHAQSMAMEYDAGVIRSGGGTDFLLASGSVPRYPAARVDRVLHDGDTVTLGGVTLTAHRTAGHTRGCTTWTMQVHLPGEPADRLRNVVIVGGYTLWSDFKLVDSPGHPASYPGIADDFRRTFALYESLPCDIFLGDHGEHFGLLAKVARMPQEGDAVWIDPEGYRATIAAGKAAFEKALAEQQRR
ncbi:metallo-beta-lactamase class B [Granulicella rosea]|uniref:Metallo-beta-lactamase class B n=1 Tax=Granulicella rosea TaxID=474952 RepID=A0A239MDE2_9BACT|nr:subclass B3 metallo-beta-lactamase [Granulicella rosea]SNT40074.1 metallo-beta-lactamase class B [Granulicella rosea]